MPKLLNNRYKYLSHFFIKFNLKFCFFFSQGKMRDLFTQQLGLSSHAIPRTRIKVFGHQGVGKTTLIDSLKCGFFRGLLRKSRSNLSLSAHTSPQKRPMLSIHRDSQLMEEGVLTRHVSTSSVIDYCNMTKGIQFTYANIPGNVNIAGNTSKEKLMMCFIMLKIKTG